MNKPGWGCFLGLFWMAVLLTGAIMLLIYGDRRVDLLGLDLPGSWLALPASFAVGVGMMIIGPKIFYLGPEGDDYVR